MKNLIRICFACLALSGCATVHYGRQEPLIPEEKAAYDCPAIALEIAKCDAFMDHVDEHWAEAKGRRIAGYLGDFGIGNRHEYLDAIGSAYYRREALVELASQKHCPTPPPAPKLN